MAADDNAAVQHQAGLHDVVGGAEAGFAEIVGSEALVGVERVAQVIYAHLVGGSFDDFDADALALEADGPSGMMMGYGPVEIILLSLMKVFCAGM